MLPCRLSRSLQPRILGVADRLGSLEVGKRANLVVTAGHILQPTTSVLALFIDGKPLTPESRHTQLYSRYLRGLEEVRAGSAPLGLDRPSTAPRASRPAPRRRQLRPRREIGTHDPGKTLQAQLSGQRRRRDPARWLGKWFLHRPG